MAVLDIELLSADTVVIDDSNSDATNTINITALGDGHLIVDGVQASVSSIASISVGGMATFEATNGGSLTLDQGLLAFGALSSTTFRVADSSTIELDASTLSFGALSNILGVNQTVEFTGQNNTGTFIYDPPTVSLLSILSPVRFDTVGMQATDEFTVQGKTLWLDTTFGGGPSSAYLGGVLNLVTGGGLLTPKVSVGIPMTQSEFNIFMANMGSYLTGDTFIFPGTILCFTRGTLIETLHGPVAIEALRPKDQIVTRDNGAQPLLWVGSRRLIQSALEKQINLYPIRIRAGALGPGKPAMDLTVSPQHRVLVSSKIAQRMVGVAEVLIAAKHLLHLDGIDIATDLLEVEYFHMLFEGHQILQSNGAETESLFTGPQALKSVSTQARAEIIKLFPKLLDPQENPPPARVLMSGRQGRTLAMRHYKNNRALVM